MKDLWCGQPCAFLTSRGLKGQSLGGTRPLVEEQVSGPSIKLLLANNHWKIGWLSWFILEKKLFVGVQGLQGRILWLAKSLFSWLPSRLWSYSWFIILVWRYLKMIAKVCCLHLHANHRIAPQGTCRVFCRKFANVFDMPLPYGISPRANRKKSFLLSTRHYSKMTLMMSSSGKWKCWASKSNRKYIWKYHKRLFW